MGNWIAFLVLVVWPIALFLFRVKDGYSPPRNTGSAPEQARQVQRQAEIRQSGYWKG